MKAPSHHVPLPSFLPACYLAAHGLPELCWDQTLTWLQDTSPWAAEGPLGHRTAQGQRQAPGIGLCHLPRCRRAPSWNQCGWVWLCLPWVGTAGSQQLRARAVCEAPALERAHAGVWVCHSPVSKLISGSLTRGIKSRSHNGIHSSSCPGKEQAPHCPLGLGLGQAKVASAQLPAGGPCLRPPSSCHRTRLALERGSCERNPREMPNAGCRKVFPSQGTPAVSAGAAGVSQEG